MLVARKTQSHMPEGPDRYIDKYRQLSIGHTYLSISQGWYGIARCLPRNVAKQIETKKSRSANNQPATNHRRQQHNKQLHKPQERQEQQSK